MKTLFTFSVLFFASLNIIAQSVPNGNFEEWEFENGNIEQPVGWFTNNEQPPYTSVQKTTDAFEGDYAMKLSAFSFHDYGPGPGVGKALTFLTADQAYNYLNAVIKIDSITAGDTMEINVYRGGAGIPNLIGRWKSGTKTNGWENISIPINLQSPSLMTIEMYAFPYTQNGAYGEPAMLIDNLEMSLISPTSEINNRVFKVFPNPVGQELTVETQQPIAGNSTMTLYNQLGQQVHSAILQSGQTSHQVQLHGLADGIYFYEIENKKVVLGSGKVIVQKT